MASLLTPKTKFSNPTLLTMFRLFLYFLSATLLLIASSPSAKANRDEVPQVVVPAYPHTSSQTPMILPSSSSDMIQAEFKSDPLDSPHPVPWNWVLETNENLKRNESSGVNYYRSPSLISPDGTYAAYSRIQMEGRPELFRSRVTSVMFLENLRTGDLQTITASSPLADNPFNSNEEATKARKNFYFNPRFLVRFRRSRFSQTI